MTQNELTTEGIIRKETICDGENNYAYILTRQVGTMVSSFKIALYSIRIDMWDKAGEQSYYKLRNVFASEEKALRFFSKLVENLVTPINLPFVFEDEMS